MPDFSHILYMKFSRPTANLDCVLGSCSSDLYRFRQNRILLQCLKCLLCSQQCWGGEFSFHAFPTNSVLGFRPEEDDQREVPSPSSRGFPGNQVLCFPLGSTLLIYLSGSATQWGHGEGQMFLQVGVLKQVSWKDVSETEIRFSCSVAWSWVYSNI